jgi:hypothetical protein
MNENSVDRVLAVDVRADRIGYAAFDTPGHLLDYGTSRLHFGETGRVRTEFLLRALAPSVLVLRRPRTRSTRKRLNWARNQRMIEREARKLRVRVAFVGERALKRLFAEFNCRNKFQIATLLGTWFPEVSPKVPLARKCYEPEPWGIAQFDAIALGVTYATTAQEEKPSSSSE